MAPLSAGSSDPVALYDLAVLLTSALDSCHIDQTSELFKTLLHCQYSVLSLWLLLPSSCCRKRNVPQSILLSRTGLLSSAILAL